MSEIIRIDVGAAPRGILKEDWEETIIESLYASTPELGAELNPKIQDRTPEYMGNLRLSEKFIPNTNRSNPTLVEFFPADQEQMDELGRGRIYAPYVEGILPTDLSIWPIRISHMYGRAEEEDLDTIEEWAYLSIEDGLSRLIGGP